MARNSKSACASGSTDAAPQINDAGAASFFPIILNLPAPPSVNQAYRNKKRGRVLTQAAKDWKSYAGHVLASQSPGYLPGKVVVIFNVERRSKTADIDNRTKLLLDLLVTEGVIDDDRHTEAIAAGWTAKNENMARVAIFPATESLTITYQPSAENGAGGGWVIPAPSTYTEEAA